MDFRHVAAKDFLAAGVLFATSGKKLFPCISEGVWIPAIFKMVGAKSIFTIISCNSVPGLI